MSIYAELNMRFESLTLDPDDNLYQFDSFIASLPADDRELYLKEAVFVFEFMRGRGNEPDFSQICERAIMERFADEEAARTARAA